MRPVSVERPAFKVGLGFHLETASCSDVRLPLMIMAVRCAQTVQTLRFLQNAGFPSGGLEFWFMLIRGCSRDQPPVRTLVPSL